TFNAQQTVGFDADMSFAVTPRWKILANFATQQAVLTDVPTAPTQVGNHPVGVPAQMANLWTTYDFAIGALDGFRIGGGSAYNDRSFANNANPAWIPAATVIDALFGYFQPKWDVQLNIKNLTNVTYYTTAQSAGGYVGLPQSFYLKANWRY